jgi:hypothetical protein
MNNIPTEKILSELTRRFPMGVVFGAFTDDPSLQNPYVYASGSVFVRKPIIDLMEALSSTEYHVAMANTINENFNNEEEDDSDIINNRPIE